jgi:hypothetical protein
MQEPYKPARIPVLILALGALLLCTQPAFAARFVLFEVSIDGKVVLETGRWDEGADADTVWRYLKQQLRPVKGYKVEVDSNDPLRATLKGKVIIESGYGGQAEVSELKLVREKDDAPWKIDPTEVERTFKSRNKPLDLSVSIDGKTVLLATTTTAWAIGADVDTVWRNLKRVELQPWQLKNKVEADTDDPLRATLKGKVIIQADVGGHFGERAEVSELKLVREKDNAPWKIAPAEVERTFKGRNQPRYFRVSIDGKKVLGATAWAIGADADTVWRSLKRVELQPVKGYKVEADSDDPLRATLKGEVIIQAYVGGHIGERAEVSELKLVREKDDALWKVAPAEVERTFKGRNQPK